MFSSPFNWCDRRCERCRLSPICGVAQRSKELPSDLGAALEVTFRETLTLLEQIVREEGIDLDGVSPPRPPISERAKRLQEILGPPAIDFSEDELVVRMKLARLADRLDAPEADEIYCFDTVPNLLLLERLIEHLHPLKAGAMREELAPLFEAIEAPLRRAVETLIETGLAPSPFCVVEEAGGDAQRRS